MLRAPKNSSTLLCKALLNYMALVLCLSLLLLSYFNRVGSASSDACVLLPFYDLKRRHHILIAISFIFKNYFQKKLQHFVTFFQNRACSQILHLVKHAFAKAMAVEKKETSAGTF